MHKISNTVLYKKGWIYLPKELIDLSKYQEIVILPWAPGSILLLSEEECSHLNEFIKSLGTEGRVLLRLLGRAVWTEIKPCHHRRNKIRLPEFMLEHMCLKETECLMTGSPFEKRNIKGIQIEKNNLNDEE